MNNLGTGVKAKAGRIVVALYDKEPMFGPGAPYRCETPVTAASTATMFMAGVAAGDDLVSAFMTQTATDRSA